jgi:hypothetical protein
MTIISKFFQFFSKTDRRVIALCTDYCRKTQTSFGIFVLLTGVFAFLSCMYAVNATFDNHYVSIPVALLYCTVIIFIDREIVSGQKKSAILPRVALAAAVGFVISVPLEMRLFQPRIEQELKRMYNDENSGALEDQRRRDDAFQQRVNALETDIRTYGQNVHDATLAMQDEVVGTVREGSAMERTGRAGRGVAYEEARQVKERNEQLLSQAVKSLSELRGLQQTERQQNQNEFNRREVRPAYDFLARYEAMERAKERAPAALRMSWGLRLLIILIEILPALMKLFQQDNEYTGLLEAVRRRNLTRIYAITNDHIDQIVRTPHVAPLPPLMKQLEDDPLTT